MADYATWDEKKLRPTALLLDATNPRIPPAGRALSQRDVIADLVAHDQVYELARNMAQGGFTPVESLIGVEADADTVILEGNRRLAALKLLNEPTLAPDEEVRNFRRLASLPTLVIPDRVRVLIAPSREAAAPLILNKHTRDQVERWSPLQQARFYRSLVDSAGSVEDVSKAHGVPAGEILEALRLESMYEVAQAAELSEAVKKTVNDPRAFKASVLVRLLEVAKFKDFLGLWFDDAGRVFTKVKPRDFGVAFGRVLTDIATGKENTRTLNTPADIEEYVDKRLKDITPKKTTRKYLMRDLIGDQTLEASPAEESPVDERPRGGSKSTGPIPRSIKCTIDNPRAKAIFRELKRTNPKRLPNAHAVLQRVLLEIGVSHYLDRSGQLEPLERKIRAERKRGEVYPTLGDMLRQLLKDPALDRMASRARQAIERLISRDKSFTSVDTMNGFVHSDLEWPDEREIARIWRVMEPVLVVVLTEQADQQATK